VTDFLDEICDPGRASQGGFAQGALVQETINAFERSFRTRAWASFPLDGAAAGEGPAGGGPAGGGAGP
jgi:hypothetical protein